MLHFQKGEKSVIYSHFETNFVMFPEYIYKPFDSFTKIIIVTIDNYTKTAGEIYI